MKVDTYIDQLEKINGRLSKVVVKNATLMDEILRTELESLLFELKAERGNIVDSVENLEKVYQFSSKVDAVLAGDNGKVIQKELADAYREVTKLNNTYFSSLVADYSADPAFVNTLANISFRNTISTLQSQLNLGVSTQVVEVVKNSILSKASYADTLDAVRQVLKNTQGDAKLVSYYKTITNDAVYQYSRSYQDLVTKDLGLDWFLYEGGIQETTRYFCSIRHGKFFHRKEIAYWGETPSLWNAPPNSKYSGGGRHPATNKDTIFTFVGGYGCKHVLIAVSERVVPKEDKTRFEKLKLEKGWD
jgi:hypothetical protein